MQRCEVERGSVRVVKTVGFLLATFNKARSWLGKANETEVFKIEDEDEILDYGTDNEEEEDRFANDGLQKGMMLPRML